MLKHIPKTDLVFVALQILLFVGYGLPLSLFPLPHHSLFLNLGLIGGSIGIGLLFIAVAQLRHNLSPFPSPKPKASLLQNGIYTYIRHPIYTGILCFAFGFALYEHSSFKILISSILIIFFTYKSKYEEQRLFKKFPEYAEYKKRTGRFLPKL